MSAYRCGHCGGVFPSHRLSCPECGAWNMMQREEGLGGSAPVALPAIGAVEPKRLMTGVGAFDRLLGGGFIRGTSLLLTGPPGAGKSTLVMQILRGAAVRALYATGEESIVQLKLRAERLGINADDIFLLFETSVSRILREAGPLGPLILVVDSIQTVYTDLSETLPGSPTQIRKCTYLLRRNAQERESVLFLIGQVTKGKGAAGPRLLEHAVDVVLSLEAHDDGMRSLTVEKNRFGPTLALRGMHMGEMGLQFVSEVRS